MTKRDCYTPFLMNIKIIGIFKKNLC